MAVIFDMNFSKTDEQMREAVEKGEFIGGVTAMDGMYLYNYEGKAYMVCNADFEAWGLPLPSTGASSEA